MAITPVKVQRVAENSGERSAKRKRARALLPGDRAPAARCRRRHHGVDAGADGGAEGKYQFCSVSKRVQPRCSDRGQGEVRIGFPGVAMPREGVLAVANMPFTVRIPRGWLPRRSRATACGSAASELVLMIQIVAGLLLTSATGAKARCIPGPRVLRVPSRVPSW